MDGWYHKAARQGGARNKLISDASRAGAGYEVAGQSIQGELGLAQYMRIMMYVGVYPGWRF